MIEEAKKRLKVKLQTLDLNSLKVSNYNKKYFGGYLNHLDNILDIYSYLLSLCNITKNSVILDYGGGSGLLSLLNKEIGATTLYSDIYDVSCHDAEVIAEAIGNKADHYVCGDINNVIEYLKCNKINCNIVISYDVIEHIYNIEDFFNNMQYITDKSLIIVMASNANSLNPVINKRLMKSQIIVENEDRPYSTGHKERDNNRAFRNIRKEMIIRECVLNNITFNDDILSIMIENTRGMIEEDIKECIKTYITSGVIPNKILHPTNTCDPYTGNWSERLMNPYHLKDLLNKFGFKSMIVNGYYVYDSALFKNCMHSILNVCINMLGPYGIRLAPYYIIYGKK